MSSTLAASSALRSRGDRRLIEQRAEGQHLAEHARGLGERQRRRRHQRALHAGQHLMHAVAELVRERHHVARLALVVEQDVGVRGRHRRMREGAGRLALPCTGASIQPLREEAPGDVGHPRREIAIGREHGACAHRPSRSPARAPRAAARCGPNSASSSCRAISPSWRSSGARCADRPRARRRPARRPPPSRPDWRDGGSRPRP